MDCKRVLEELLSKNRRGYDDNNEFENVAKEMVPNQITKFVGQKYADLGRERPKIVMK